MELKRTFKGSENGFDYKLNFITDDEKYHGYTYVYQIEWVYENRNIQVDIEYGTLRAKFVSLDGEYLILIFIPWSTEYPSPCNAVVYNRKGELVHILSAPNLSNPEIFEKFKGRPDMQGSFTGGGIRNWGDKQITTIGIEYRDIQRPTGSFPYTESRLFNPETGEIGEIIEWELPWR